jgi:hypothetical protein
MDSKVLSDVASGVFRLRQDDPHMSGGTVVDVHDDDYTTLTTVEVRSGTVVVHCLASLEDQQVEEVDEEEDDEHEGEEATSDEESSDEESADEEEDEYLEVAVGKTYTLSAGNSVTVRAVAVRLVPIGTETAEGIYQVQMMKAAD